MTCPQFDPRNIDPRGMPRTARRIRLPSGGWWDLETRPRWGHVRRWTAADVTLAPSAGPGGEPPGRLADRALVALTVGWSFPEHVDLASLRRRDAADVAAVLRVLHGDVLRTLVAESPEDLAEDLFVGLVRGEVPPRFAEVHLMALTGWSWRTLLETPVDVVEKMAIYLAVTRVRRAGGALYPAEVGRGN